MGIPHQVMISFNRHLVTSWAFSVHVGKASTYPEKEQTPTDISMQSRIRFSRRVPPTLHLGRHIWRLPGVVFGI
jgi:hypothetical protein